MNAIRGAIQVEHNTAESLASAVRKLCAALTELNRLRSSEIVSAVFTTTPDLDADFPARIAREHGWGDVPMLCAQEIAVPGALARVCRVLVHVRGRRRPRHVYLGGARSLRPDLPAPAVPAPRRAARRGAR